jgi:hypothetical protein
MANPHWNFDEVAATVPENGADGDDSYTYRMYKSGPDVTPGEVELAHSEAVEITIRWGSNVLSTQHLSSAQSFTVGEGSATQAVDYFLPREKLGTERLPLVKRVNGAPVLVIPEGARGRVSKTGQGEASLDAIRMSATPSSEVANAVEWPLPPDTEVYVELSDLSFVVRTTLAGKPIPHGIASDLDWTNAAYFGASFVSAGALLAAAAFFMPPMGLTSGETTLDEQRMLIMPYLEALAEKEQEPEESPETGNETTGGTGERATGQEGAMGKQESTQQNRRYAVKGDAKNPDPHLAREQALREAASFGIIGLLSSANTGDPNAPTSPWGRDTSLGLDDVSAMGNMWGDEIGEAAGAGGLGLAGLSQGGGGTGFGIGLGTVGTFGHGSGLGTDQGFGNGHGRLPGSHQVKAPISRIGNPTISGRLPPQVIQRIVRQNFGRFRLCYEKALAVNPNLEGRVAVRFVIDRTGAVSNVANGGSSIPSADVTSCVVRAFYGLSFPKPEGGIVTVSYPLSFSPG